MRARRMRPCSRLLRSPCRTPSSPARLRLSARSSPTRCAPQCCPPPSVRVNPDVQHAARILKRGGLVAFPTETVYGLGADASNPEAIARLYSVKGRPSDHPVIVHFATAERALAWARDVPDHAREL